MAGLHFDSSFNSEPVTKALEKIQKGVYETAKAAELAGGRIDEAFNRISLKGIERIYELMQNFPKEIQGIESFKKQMADLEKRLEQANKKIVELQNQAEQPITVRTNTSEVTRETSAYDSLLESLNDILGARGQNISAILQEQNAIRLNQKELKVLERIENEGLKLSEAQQARRIQLTNSIMQHKQAISSLQQVVNNEMKLEEAAKGSMEEMSQSLGRMRMAYRQLAEQERNSKFGQDLLISIQEADSKIKQLDATIGNHQRNVGDYQSQWNGLNMSIQQVAREMPSLANGPKTFFSAISNNLPILADEIKRAKEEFNSLKAEGKDATPVWKQVASSLLSWNTALTIGITLLTLYGDKLVDLVGGLFNAKDATKELLSAEQEMALARKKAISDSANERTELDLLYNKLKNNTISTKERNAAVSEWMKRYPQHSNIMNGELVSLGKLDLAYQSLSKQIIESAKARAYSDKITELTKKRDDAEFRRLNSLNSLEKSKGALVNNNSDLQRTITYNAQKQYDAIVQEVANYDSKIESIGKNIKLDNLFPQATKGTYDYWQQQVQIADSALKQIDSKQKVLLDNTAKDPKTDLHSLGIGKSIVDSYKSAVKAKKEAEKELKAYPSTSDTTKEESAAEKLRKEQEKYNLLLDQQKREAARMKTDSQHELEQIEIDGLVEGSEKILRQRKLNHEKELEAIKREAADNKLKAIEAARSAHESNPDKKKGTFDADKFVKSEPVKKQFAIFDKTAESKTKTENTKYNRGDDLSGLLNEYQDYTDKRLAIETKYNNDLATLEEQRKQAVKDGDAKQVEQIDRAKAQATTNKGKELMSMDYDKLKESPEYVRAFENLKETSSETLNSLLTQLENAKTAAAKVLSPDQLREYTTTIQEIMNELDERNPFQALSDKKQELADAEQELAQAQIELENARQTAETVKGGGKVEYTTTKFNQKTGKIDSTKAYLTEAQALENVKTKTDNYNKSKDNAVKASTKVRKSEKEVRDIIDDLSKSISDVGNSIGGPAGEIISLIGNIGSFAMMAMSGVETASKTTSTAIQTVEKASVILAIISAAIQIATKMLDMFGGDDTTEKYEKTKETYESYINILDQVIDKQLEMAESLSGASAQAAYDKAIELVKAQSEAARVLGKQYLNSGASWKTHSKGYEEVEDMSYEGWADAAKALGMSVDQIKNTLGGRMDGLFDLTDEQLAKLQGEAHIFWAQLDDDTQDYANQIAEGVEKVAEVIEQRMADVTLIDVDTLRSDFHDLLTDMDADTADFADNFEEYMKNAILNSMLKEQYMGRLTEWRKKFYEAMGDGVTKEEYNDLKSEGQQISDEMKAERDKMAEMFGWTSGESSSQDSTNGGFETMSQDTGTELNGRFTALQISNEEIKNSMLSMLVSVNFISVSVSSNGITLTEIRNLMISSNGYLEDIAKYTKELIGFKQTIFNIETSAKAMAGK